MADVPVVDKSGKSAGSVEFPDALATCEASDHLVWEVVRAYLLNKRVGTAKVKNRIEQQGGGRKPWRQKGTGRSRHGSQRSPLWRGGGAVHGPVPRDFRVPMPRRKRRLALRRVFSDLLSEGRVLVLDDLQLEAPKTRELAGLLEALGVAKTMLVDSGENRNLQLASRNLPAVEISRPEDLNAYDLLRQEHMTISREALGKLEEVLSR
jgi:large subunit ribosomal protein L4